MLLGQAEDMAIPAYSPHGCKTGSWELLGLLSQGAVGHMLAPQDAFNPPEGPGVSSLAARVLLSGHASQPYRRTEMTKAL